MVEHGPLPDLKTLMATDANGLGPFEAMQLIAMLIDAGGDAGDIAALDRAETLLDRVTPNDGFSARYQCRAHYYRANIWSYRRRLSGIGASWTWRAPEIDNELLELRRALAHPGWADLHDLERAQVLTNLGSTLNHIGRFVEAIEAWDRALALAPTLAMANGNRGLGLMHYASGLYDPGHQTVLGLAARRSLSAAGAPNAIIESQGLDPALRYFAAGVAAIDSTLDVAAATATIDLTGHSLGRGKAERAYRTWCLRHRLFLNPLNDAGPDAIAAQDVMTLPTLVTDFSSGPAPPAVFHYFNGLKQEYASARFALHEGLTARDVHFSDRGVRLYNTLDYPAFGLGVERLKMAFRGAYALLDKIGFVLNAYLDLGHAERQVSFRNVWFETPRAKALHPALDGLANWPLRGLFWLSKDVFEDAFRQVTEPDAQALYDLRNHMEHKFVGVFDEGLRSLSPTALPPPRGGVFEISSEQLAARALRQVKLARAAMIYLAMGVQVEEARRAAGRDPQSNLSMPVDLWDDDWKRSD